MKTWYEKLGGTDREENGRLIPEMKLPEQTNYQIGKYGQYTFPSVQVTPFTGTKVLQLPIVFTFFHCSTVPLKIILERALHS